MNNLVIVWLCMVIWCFFHLVNSCGNQHGNGNSPKISANSHKPARCSFPPSATFIVRWLWCGYHVLVKMTGYNCHSVGQNPLLRMSMTRNAARNVPHPIAGHRMFQVPAWMGGPCSVACAKTPAGHFAITKRKVVGVATFYHQLVGFPELFCGTNSANMLLMRVVVPHLSREGC